MAPPNLKNMIKIKIKPRQDSYTDQFSRIFMVKMLMMSAAFTGISWMKDKLICVIPKTHGTTNDFVSKACWINGLYVYRDLKPSQSSYYYGIPSDITHDGMNKYGSLCDSKSSSKCEPLEKTFFLQYQWFPLAVAALAFLYYAPYLLFRAINTDIQTIKELIKGKNADEVNYKQILNTFFNHQCNTKSHHQARIMLNILVKILYVIANVGGMLVIDSCVNGEYMAYGGRWANWTDLTNEGMHDYTNPDIPKASHYLLPGFGICEVQTSAQDIKSKVINVQTYVCELSQHVLYQHILIIMWYVFVLGIIVSIIGLSKHVISQATVMLCFESHGPEVTNVYRYLTAREREYMDFVRRKNLPVFGELLKRLRDMKTGSVPSRSNRSSCSPEKEKMGI